VPPALAAATVRNAPAFAAGAAGPAGAGPAAVLAEGVLHSMFLSKVKMAIVVLLALGVLGSGAGMFARHTEAAGAPAPVKPGTAKAAPDKGPAGKPAQEEGNSPPPSPDADRRAQELNKALSQVINFKGFEDPKTTLIEALDILGKQYNVTFDVNEKAFAADNALNDVLRYEIASPNPIPEMRASLRAVVKKILSRLPVESGATLVIRKDFIEITTQKAVRDELGLPEGRALLPLVFEDFDDQPLPVALRTLANATGLSVVLDHSAADKLPKVTAQFHNVPVDTAVRVLADMADLGMVRLDNVLYVTARDKAARLQADQPAPKPTPKPAPRPAKEEKAAAKP
jgi:hypothetical protein